MFWKQDVRGLRVFLYCRGYFEKNKQKINLIVFRVLRDPMLILGWVFSVSAKSALRILVGQQWTWRLCLDSVDIWECEVFLCVNPEYLPVHLSLSSFSGVVSLSVPSFSTALVKPAPEYFIFCATVNGVIYLISFFELLVISV